MAKILISTWPTALPLIRKLIAIDHTIYTIHPEFAKSIRDLDLKATPLMEINTPELQSNAIKTAAKMVAKSLSPIDTKDLSPIISNWLKNDLGAYFYPKMGDVCLFIELLNNLNPDIIVLHNDVEILNRAAALWGRNNNTPVLHIPHAIYQNVDNLAGDIHTCVTATHIAISGDYQEKWYQERGTGETAYLIKTGLPQFDEWATRSYNQAQSRALLGLDITTPVITYCSSWRQNTNLLGMHDGVEESYRGFLEAIKNMSNIQFLIKCHPRGRNLEWHKKLAEEMGIKGLVLTAHHLDHCLAASDVLLAYGPSNVLLEASHIPWLRLACTSGYEDDTEVMKISTDPPISEHIEKCLYDLLNKPPIDYSAFRYKYLGPCDGNNTNRIGQLILGLINAESMEVQTDIAEPVKAV